MGGAPRLSKGVLDLDHCEPLQLNEAQPCCSIHRVGRRHAARQPCGPCSTTKCYGRCSHARHETCNKLLKLAALFATDASVRHRYSAKCETTESVAITRILVKTDF